MHLPSTLGAPTSQYKIQCNKSSVLIGDRKFLSATDALEAYLSQYESQGFLSNQPTYKRTVNDLLNPKSALHMTAERSLDTGIRATDKELHLADQKDSINESLLNMKKSVALKAEGMMLYLLFATFGVSFFVRGYFSPLMAVVIVTATAMLEILYC